MRFIPRINRNKMRRIVIFALSLLMPLTSVFSLVGSASALESSPITMNNIKSDFDNSARAEHAAFKLYQCLVGDGGIHIGGSGWLTNYGGDGYNYSTTFGGEGGLFYHESANPFDGAAAIGLHSLSAGRWLEHKVQGDFDDGKIDCGDNKDHIIDVFAALIGLESRAEVFCDGTAPGILRNADGGACGDSSAEYVVDSGWEAHLAKLYDNYVNEKNYPVTWSVLSSNNFEYSHIDGYFLYTQEIQEGCGGSRAVTKTDTEAPTVSHSPTPLKRLDDYGNTTYEWFAGKGGEALSESGFVARADGWTCKQYIERANDDEIFGKFRDLILERIKAGCYEARKTQIAEAQSKFDESKAGMTDEEIAADESIAEDQAILDAANSLISAYEGGDKDALVEQYKDDDGNTGDGLMCKNIDGLSDVGMAAYDVPDIIDSDETDVTCFTAGGSLGWILCPILEFTTDTVDTLYNSVIEPYLVMNTTLFTDGGKSNSTYKAWQTFQGIANTCFVILFIIVIFSQITGVGIDNYGIKKILPKLITAALLINLSYIICELAIDISNIVGSGIKNIFDGLITDVSLSKITVENGTEASFGATAITGGVALLAVIVGAVALYTNGAAILIPLFIAAISVLVSIFFLFVLLSLRKAAVVILVVVSPLAFGCYMLPNTKKIFDKWFKALQGMLLLYPIAGALVGGGNYVSKVLLSTGGGTTDFFFALSAMIIGIVPIFFIPGLLKASFAAIGNVGAKLSAMGGRFGRNLGGRIDRSGMARNLRDSRDRRNAMNSAGIKLNKRTGEIQYTRRGKLQNMMPHTTAGKQRIDAARNAAANDILRQKKAGSMMGDAGLSRMAAMDLAAQNREEAQEVQDEIARLSSQENLFDTAKLREALEDEARSATGDEPSLKFKALATALSQRGGEGKKALTSVMRSGGTGAKQLAAYATTGDSGVLSAIGDKDAFAQQYARDLAAGNTTATKFDDWLDQTSSGDATMTNRQFVTANVLDDNERLMAQSAPALQNALDAKDNKSGESIINADRAEGILSDPALVKNKPENAKTIKKQVLPHGVTTERGVSYSINNTTTGNADIVTGRRTEDGSFIYTDSSGRETVLSASELAAKNAKKVN